MSDRDYSGFAAVLISMRTFLWGICQTLHYYHSFNGTLVFFYCLFLLLFFFLLILFRLLEWHLLRWFTKPKKIYEIVCCAQSAAQTAEKWKQLWLCLCGPNTIPELFKFERWTKGRSNNIFMKMRQTKLVLSWMKEFFCSFADRYIYRPHFGVRILAYGSIERYIYRYTSYSSAFLFGGDQVCSF